MGGVRKPLGAVLESAPGKQAAPGALEAGLVKPDGERASAAGAAQVVAVKDGEVVGIAPSDFKGAGSGHEPAGGTPQSGTRSEAKGPLAEKAGDTPLGARPAGALSVKPVNRAGDAQEAGKSAVGIKEERGGAAARVAPVASPSDEKKPAIPSSNAVGVAALNEAGRRREETPDPPRELVEAARDALHGDSKDEGKAEEARPAEAPVASAAGEVDDQEPEEPEAAADAEAQAPTAPPPAETVTPVPPVDFAIEPDEAERKKAEWADKAAGE